MVAIQTSPYHFKDDVFNCHQLFILQHHSWLSDLTEGIRYVSCRFNDSCESVMYSCVTRTCNTVVSKFPGEPRMYNSGYLVLLSNFC